MTSIAIHRTGLTLRPDPARVLVRPFNPTNEKRARKICARVLALAENEVSDLLAQVEAEFGERHRQTREFFQRRFKHAQVYLAPGEILSEKRQLLLGAHFTHEYSLESAALFNPSIVPHPDQSNLPEGSLRFIISLRATGEGHISSITFRTGIVDANNQISINTPTRYLMEPKQIPNFGYERELFERKLYELQLTSPFSR